MKTKRILLCVLLANIGVAYATPPSCPSVAAIPAVGWSGSVYSKDLDWAVFQNSASYGTSVNWSFVLGPLKATDEKEAFTKATELSKSLILFMGPYGDEDQWTCMYTGPNQLFAFAFNPPDVKKGLKLQKQG